MYQTAVDAEHSLVVATNTINRNDKMHCTTLAKRQKENIKAEALTVIADKGYHTGKELQSCQTAAIETVVARQEIVNSNDKGTQPEYLIHHLHTTKKQIPHLSARNKPCKQQAKWHTKKRSEDISYQFKNTEQPLVTLVL